MIRQPVHGFHCTVAFLTSDIAVNMALMIEQHMFCHIVDFLPRGGCVAVIIIMLLFDPWMISDNIFVAMEAFFRWWQAGMI